MLTKSLRESILPVIREALRLTPSKENFIQSTKQFRTSKTGFGILKNISWANVLMMARYMSNVELTEMSDPNV